MSEQPERHTLLDLLDGAGSGLVGIGLIVMTAFPLALPFILLLAIVAIPAIVGGLAASVFVVPAALLWRRLAAGPRGRTPTRTRRCLSDGPGQPAGIALRAAPIPCDGTRLIREHDRQQATTPRAADPRRLTTNVQLCLGCERG